MITFGAKLEQKEQNRMRDKKLNRRQSVLALWQTGADAQRINSQISLHRRRQMRPRTQLYVNLKISLIDFI